MSMPVSENEMPKLPFVNLVAGVGAGAVAAGVGLSASFCALAVLPTDTPGAALFSIPAAFLVAFPFTAAPAGRYIMQRIEKELSRYDSSGQAFRKTAFAMGSLAGMVFVGGMSTAYIPEMIHGDKLPPPRLPAKVSAAPSWVPTTPFHRDMTAAQAAARAGLKMPKPV